MSKRLANVSSAGPLSNNDFQAAQDASITPARYSFPQLRSRRLRSSIQVEWPAISCFTRSAEAWRERRFVHTQLFARGMENEEIKEELDRKCPKEEVEGYAAGVEGDR